jgi:Ca-activated chloride channel family protein
VRAIYSPSHPIAIARDGDFRFSAGYEANNVTPDTDFDLYYSVSPDDIGLNTLSYFDPTTGEGYFLLLAAPRLDVSAAQVVAKDVIVVLDQSGSMDGIVRPGAGRGGLRADAPERRGPLSWWPSAPA